jgi:hypothetical protein
MVVVVSGISKSSAVRDSTLPSEHERCVNAERCPSKGGGMTQLGVGRKP